MSQSFSSRLRDHWRGQATGEATLLSVGRDNFHTLHLKLAELTGRPTSDFPAYSPHPLPEAEDLLYRWLAGLRSALSDSVVEIEAPSTDLMTLLRAVARAADLHNSNELLRLLGALTGGVFVGPATFHLDVANACNVNCKYCWFHSPLSKNRKDAADFDAAWRSQMVDWDVFKSIIDDLKALGTNEDVLLSGKGEPLLHPRCLDMVRYVKAQAMGLTLFSNGLLVRQAAREALVEAGADLLYVSLSSASESIYEAIHPGHEGSELGVVRANITALNELKQERGSPKPRVMMVDVLCRLNAAEALDFYEQARDLGAEHVRFQLIHIQDYNRELSLLPEQIGPLREAIAEAQRRAEAGGPTVVPNIHYQLETIDPNSGKWGHARTPDEGCYVGWSFSRSWTNGDISFCCSPKVVDQVGSLADQGGRRRLATIWNGPGYSTFRQAARDLEANAGMTFSNGATLLGEHCSGCPNYEGIGKIADDLRRYGLAGFVRGSDAIRLAETGSKTD